MSLKLTTIILLLLAQSVFALGIYPTEIFFPDELIMGKRYKNNQIRVVNTSDKGSWFSVGVANLQKEGFDKLNPDWVKLSPQFYLMPGDSQQIQLSLKIPNKTKLKYWQIYGVIETQAISNDVGGVVGIALGSKLTFKVSKKNVSRWRLFWWNILDRIRWFFAWVSNYLPFKIIRK